MSKMLKMLLGTFMLVSVSHAKIYFSSHDDICEGTKTHKCSNDYDSIKKLQIVLNNDKKLRVHLKVDGKWGEKTKKSILAFQKKHKLSSVDGWVGKETKIKLNKIARKIKFHKSSKKKHISRLKTKKHFACYGSFKKCVNVRRSYRVFKDAKLLAKANGRNTHLKIDVSEQRVKLLVNGKVALDAPCTTGARHKLEPNTRTYRDKHTPIGTYRIMEKIAAKKSTIFGEMYRHGKRVYHGDRRKYRGAKAKYVGHVMHNWMRLTSGGIGLHASKYVKRYPGSNGCIRLQPKIARVIFRKVRKGTRVSVVN